MKSYINMEVDRLKDTLQFIENIFTETESEHFQQCRDFMYLVNKYIKFKNEEQKKYPYHVNPIEELHANENANSRILCAMLRYQIDGEYKILKSFIDRFIPEIQFNISSNPVIMPEQYRIDLSVRDKKGGYAIIFENKIHGAVLQKNQIARYVEKLHTEEGFDYKQIYVVFLPSSEFYETNDCCWYKHEECCDYCNGECSLKQNPTILELRKEFEDEGRYKKVTFRNDVLSWLKEDVLPYLLYKETLLQASVILYIDYLEGLFNLRKTDNMSVELEKVIVQQMKLDKNQSEYEKIEIMDNYIKQISVLKNSIDGLESSIVKLKENEANKLLNKIEEFKGMNPEFYFVELKLAYKDYYIYIGRNKTKIYYSIKTKEDLCGKGTPKKILDIFNQKSDKYNSYGWSETDINFWENHNIFFQHQKRKDELWNNICQWINQMKEAIDKLEFTSRP